MKLTEEQFNLIAEYFPVQRGNVNISNLDILNAILYILENGCKWRALPPAFGNWHTVYTRMNRWSKSGVLSVIFAQLQHKRILALKIETVSMDNTNIKVHPDGMGTLKNSENNRAVNLVADAIPRFIWLPQMIGLQ